MTVTPDQLDALPIGTIVTAHTVPRWASQDDEAELEVLRWERVDQVQDIDRHGGTWSTLDQFLDGDRYGASSADLLEHGPVEPVALPMSAVQPVLDYAAHEFTKLAAQLGISDPVELVTRPRTINADTVLAALREIGAGLDAGPRSGPMAAVTCSNAIQSIRRLVDHIEGQAS